MSIKKNDPSSRRKVLHEFKCIILFTQTHSANKNLMNSWKIFCCFFLCFECKETPRIYLLGMPTSILDGCVASARKMFHISYSTLTFSPFHARGEGQDRESRKKNSKKKMLGPSWRLQSFLTWIIRYVASASALPAPLRHIRISFGIYTLHYIVCHVCVWPYVCVCTWNHENFCIDILCDTYTVCLGDAIAIILLKHWNISITKSWWMLCERKEENSTDMV